jgi:putative membrane protein
MKVGEKNRCWFLVLGVLFLMVWAALAVAPLDRKDWALENALVILIVPMLILTRKQFPLSRISYTAIFLFLCLHEVGAHYTYAKVPYDEWFHYLTGSTLNGLIGLERNHFDRLAHFSFGLFLAYPIREVFLRVAEVRGVWGYYLPLDVTMAMSMLYELIEWGAAELFGGDLGVAYLGTQGDVWDAHKDMALAMLGAIMAMLLTAAINAWLQRDFARELAESLKVKQRAPLGEDEIAKMLEKRRELEEGRDKHLNSKKPKGQR